MKAAVFLGPEQMEIRDVPRPQAAPDSLVIKVEACAVCGSDARIYGSGNFRITPPQIIGHEVAGTIAEVGSELKGFSVGQRVAIAPAIPCGECFFCERGEQTACENSVSLGYHYAGGFAEYMEVPWRAIKVGCVNTVPEHIPFEEAVLAEPLSCAINAQEIADVGLGETVAIFGGGPIGFMHIELARSRGATKIILIEPNPSRREMAAPFKPDLVLDPNNDDVVKSVLEATQGRGADVVITACPAGSAQETALEIVRRRGRVSFFGGLPRGNSVIKFDSNLVHYREFFVLGANGSSPRQNRLAIDLIASGKFDVKKLITHTFPLEKTVEAIETVRRGEGLKVIIKP